MNRYPLLETRHEQSSGAALEYIEWPRVLPGYLWHIRRFAVENEDTAYTYLRAYCSNGDIKHYINEERTPAAGRLYWDTDGVTIPEGWAFGVEFSGTTSGDDLLVHINGWSARGEAIA